MMPIFLWGVSVWLCLQAFGLFFSLLFGQGLSFLKLGFRHEIQSLEQTMLVFKEWEDLFVTGCVPTDENWLQLKQLPAPWSRLSDESLRELRRSGASILPTLKRFSQLVESQMNSVKEAKSKVALSQMQAVTCMGLIPLFSGTLYLLLPGIEAEKGTWLWVTLFCLLSAILGSLWIIQMGVKARWGGLTGEKRLWPLFALTAGERMLAWVRSGIPSDLAWNQTLKWLAVDAPGLLTHWSGSVYDVSVHQVKVHHGAGIEQAVATSGESLKRSIQLSLVEGRPCSERVESVIEGLRVDIKSALDRELQILPARALKPLFICVAPGLLLLLTVGIYLSWKGAELSG